VGDFNKMESTSLDFTGLKIPRDYLIHKEVTILWKIINGFYVLFVIEKYARTKTRREMVFRYY